MTLAWSLSNLLRLEPINKQSPVRENDVNGDHTYNSPIPTKMSPSSSLVNVEKKNQ